MLQMTTWADIQRLAADLQRVQFSQAAKKLSEANCIEVVSKLIKRQLIDVVFTRDGKAYVTNKHLSTEVKNECEALGGRAALTDIVTALNIDYDHIDRTARAVVKDEDGYVLSNGELFSLEYVHKLRRELTKMMELDGAKTSAAMCKHWDLSQDLLKSLLFDNLTETDGFILDGDTLYTKAYLGHHKRILSAVMLAITKPTPISYIMSEVGLTPKRFWTAYDELVAEEEILGRLMGSRSSSNCMFVPKRFEECVRRCAQDSFKQNEYIEFSVLRKLGLGDNKQAAQQVLDGAAVEVLPSLVVSPDLLEQFLTLVKEAIATGGGMCDVQVTLQATDVPLETSDIDEICELAVKKDKNLSAANGFVFSSAMLTKAVVELGDAVEKKAQEEVDRLEKEKKQQKSGPAKKAPAQQEDEDDWGEGKKGGKKKGGKGGGGKAAKAKVEEDRPTGGNVSVDNELLEQWLRDSSAVPEEIVDVVAEKIHSEVNTKLRTRVADLLATMATGDAQSEKKKLAAIHAKARNLYDSLCTLEASTSKFSESLSVDLSAHIIKTLGSELAAAVLAHASGVENAEKLTEKQREEVIGGLASGPKEAVSELFEALKGGEFEKIHEAVENVSSRGGCALDLRTPNERAMEAWTANYIAELKEATVGSTDPAAILLSTVLLLLAQNKKPTAATGKFVHRLIADMEEVVPKPIRDLLTACQLGVVTCIKNKNDEVAKEMLDADINKLKELVLAE